MLKTREGTCSAQSISVLNRTNTSQKQSLSNPFSEIIYYRFIQQQSEKDNSLKQLIDKNRNNNFKFGDGLQHEVTSVTKANYDYKGNQAKAGLNEAQKADLKTHHFQMGSHTAEYQTSA